jgi:hypothetical protein
MKLLLLARLLLMLLWAAGIALALIFCIVMGVLIS